MTAIPRSPEYWQKVFHIQASYQDVCKHILEDIPENLFNQQRSYILKDKIAGNFFKVLSLFVDANEFIQACNLPDPDITSSVFHFSKDIFTAISQVILLISKLCIKSEVPQNIVLMFAELLTPCQTYQVANNIDLVNIVMPITKQGSLLQKDKQLWAFITPDMKFTVLNSDGDNITFTGDATRAETEDKIVRIFDKNNTLMYSFKCDSVKAASLWNDAFERPTSFYECMKYINIKTYPNILRFSSTYNIFTNDLLLIEALLTLDRPRLSDYDKVLEALTTLAIVSGNIDMLMATVITQEIYKTRQSPTLILRSDSVCTHFFRIYFQRYGHQYAKKLLKPIIEKATDLSPLLEAMPEQVGPVLFFAIDSFLNSLEDVPMQLRHLSSHLYYASRSFCTTREVVFNALTNMFVLRFLVPHFTDPKLLGVEASEAVIKKTLIPIGRLFHDSIALIGVPQRYPALQILNKDLQAYKEPILEFFAGLPLKTGEVPRYISPKMSEIDQASQSILDNIVDNREEVFKFTEAARGSPERIHPLAFRMACILDSCFLHTN